MGEVQRLTKDLRSAATSLGQAEVRFLVDTYYQLQEFRIATAHQVLQCGKQEEPHELLSWVGKQFDVFEKSIPKAMQVYAESRRDGEWLLSIHGIGPIIAAGFLAHIDITKAPTVGHIWRFAGLDPTVVWAKKQKRPWNARLKVLCWKAGDSFVKQRNSPKDDYGALYDRRKGYEIDRNESGGNAECAKSTLETRKFKDKKTKTIYESGKLPAGRIDLRARRWAVKIFLAHLHHVMFQVHYGTEPPKPYILNQGDHVHYLAPPKW